MTNDDYLDAEILPADQRRAAELTEAFILADGDRVGEILAELLDAGAERTLAVAAVLARNCAAVSVSEFGVANALRLCETTKLDAGFAE